MKNKLKTSVDRVKKLIPFIADEEIKKQAELLVKLANSQLPLIKEDQFDNYPQLQQLQVALDTIDRLYFETATN